MCERHDLKGGSRKWKQKLLFPLPNSRYNLKLFFAPTFHPKAGEIMNIAVFFQTDFEFGFEHLAFNSPNIEYVLDPRF